jgi:hypothetical protein
MIKRVTMTFNSDNDFDKRIMNLMRGEKIIVDGNLTATRLKLFIYDFLIIKGTTPIDGTMLDKPAGRLNKPNNLDKSEDSDVPEDWEMWDGNNP